MLKQFLNHIRENELCKPEQKILLAVSGGLDSIAMLHLFKEAGFSIAVAHGNFKLRGKDSDADEAFVKQLCNDWNVPFFSTQFETEEYAAQNKLSIQMAARELRYSWFDDLMGKHAFDFLATAHHVNDSIETVLMNFVHGAALKGFAGIPLKNNRVIRPMLFATREEIEGYVNEKNLKWREDQSNLTDDYQRNFMRHQIIPKLKELNSSLESTWRESRKKIYDELSLLHAFVQTWKQSHLVKKGANFNIKKSSIINSTLLWHVIKEFGFNFDQCEDAMREVNGQPGKQFLSPEYQLTLDREDLIISPHQDFWKEVLIEAGEKNVLLGSWEMKIEKLNSITLSTDSFIAVLDADKLKFPLRWRKWEAGDFFYPLGMKHRRKLSDFLIDNKVSLADKNVVTVVESGGEIVWVVGYRIDDRFKITPQTQSAISFSIAPYFV